MNTSTFIKKTAFALTFFTMFTAATNSSAAIPGGIPITLPPDTVNTFNEIANLQRETYNVATKVEASATSVEKTARRAAKIATVFAGASIFMDALNLLNTRLVASANRKHFDKNFAIILTKLEEFDKKVEMIEHHVVAGRMAEERAIKDLMKALVELEDNLSKELGEKIDLGVAQILASTKAIKAMIGETDANLKSIRIALIRATLAAIDAAERAAEESALNAKRHEESMNNYEALQEQNARLTTTVNLMREEAIDRDKRHENERRETSKRQTLAFGGLSALVLRREIIEYLQKIFQKGKSYLNTF